MRIVVAVSAFLALASSAIADATCRYEPHGVSWRIVGKCTKAEEDAVWNQYRADVKKEHALIEKRARDRAMQAEMASQARLRARQKAEQERSKTTVEHCYQKNGKLECKPTP